VYGGVLRSDTFSLTLCFLWGAQPAFQRLINKAYIVGPLHHIDIQLWIAEGKVVCTATSAPASRSQCWLLEIFGKPSPWVLIVSGACFGQRDIAAAAVLEEAREHVVTRMRAIMECRMGVLVPDGKAMWMVQNCVGRVGGNNAWPRFWLL
jgi:hypothetical protein